MTAEQRIAALDSCDVELREIMRIENREHGGRWNARAVRAVLRQVKPVGFSDAPEGELTL